jgi:hypothetical protein
MIKRGEKKESPLPEINNNIGRAIACVLQKKKSQPPPKAYMFPINHCLFEEKHLM